MFIRYRLLNRLAGRIRLSEGQTHTQKIGRMPDLGLKKNGRPDLGLANSSSA